MTAQHTPGPWTYESDHTHRQYNIRMLGHLIGTGDEAKHICTVNNLPPHVLANRDPAIAEANAHLIAAAPDLLAALRDLHERLSDLLRVICECDNTHEQNGTACCLCCAEAAIAQAEGR